MSGQVFQFVEILNRLKRGTIEGKVRWDRPDRGEPHYQSCLDNGSVATVVCVNGASVVFRMTDSTGGETLHLDSSVTSEDLLRLALLQLYVSVRDSVTRRIADEALEAVKDL